MLTTYEEYLYLLEGKAADASEKWEMVRWLGWYVEQLSPYIKPGHKHKKPSDLFALAHENAPKKAREAKRNGKMDEDTIEALNAVYNEFYKDKPTS